MAINPEGDRVKALIAPPLFLWLPLSDGNSFRIETTDSTYTFEYSYVGEAIKQRGTAKLIE